MSRQPVIVIVLAMAALSGQLVAGTYRCPAEVPAFDPQDSMKQIGIFHPETTLEVADKADASGMVPVVYKGADGKEIHALCRAADTRRGK